VRDGLVMDPRTDYSVVASRIAGLGSASISQQEHCRLQQLLADSSVHLRSRVRYMLEDFGSRSASLCYPAQAMVLCSSKKEVVEATRLARRILPGLPSLQHMCPLDIVGAFSTKCEQMTERDLNSRSIATSEDAKQARILFVAHKFETGYDNSALTFLYIFRHFAETTQQLTTQVMLRHCSKRVGKVRPVTLDFTNQGRQVLNAINIFFGDIVCRSGQLLEGRHVAPPPVRAAQPRRPSAPDSAGAPSPGASATSTRQCVEQLLVSRLQVEHLEARPIATPARAMTADAPLASLASAPAPVHVLPPARPPPRPSPSLLVADDSDGDNGINNEPCPAASDMRTDVLLLKVLQNEPGEGERTALARLAAKARKGHKSTARALSQHGTVAASEVGTSQGLR